MFTKEYIFTVGSHEVVDFVRLLGRFGFKFEMSDEKCQVDDLDPDRKTRYRKFKVYATKRQMAEMYNAVKLLVKYQLH